MWVLYVEWMSDGAMEENKRKDLKKVGDDSRKSGRICQGGHAFLMSEFIKIARHWKGKKKPPKSRDSELEVSLKMRQETVQKNTPTISNPEGDPATDLLG